MESPVKDCYGSIYPVPVLSILFLINDAANHEEGLTQRPRLGGNLFLARPCWGIDRIVTLRGLDEYAQEQQGDEDFTRFECMEFPTVTADPYKPFLPTHHHKTAQLPCPPPIRSIVQPLLAVLIHPSKPPQLQSSPARGWARNQTTTRSSASRYSSAVAKYGDRPRDSFHAEHPLRARSSPGSQQDR